MIGFAFIHGLQQAGVIEGKYNFTACKAFNSSSKQREGGEHLSVSHSDRKRVRLEAPVVLRWSPWIVQGLSVELQVCKHGKSV